MAHRVKWFDKNREEVWKVELPTDASVRTREWHDFLQQPGLMGVYGDVYAWNRTTFYFSKEKTAMMFKLRFC